MPNRFSGHACLVIALVVAGLPAVAAQLRQRSAADWIETLERPERVKGLQVDLVLSKLGLKPGQTVADLGAGAGVFSFPMAEAVAPGGTVYAVDVDQGLVDHITKRAGERGLTNVRAVLGAFTDPNLPAKDVDLGFFHDVLHHIEDRAGYLKTLASYIKPGGRVAIIELSAETGPHRSDAALVITRGQVDGWMAAAGFAPVEEVSGLPDDKWFVIYARR